MTNTKLYDRTATQAMVVLGSSALGLFFRYENDAPERVRTVLSSTLRRDPRFMALCAHYYGRMDSCPNCDRDEQDATDARNADIDDAVRLLAKYGITTGEQFVRRLAAITEG